MRSGGRRGSAGGGLQLACSSGAEYSRVPTGVTLTVLGSRESFSAEGLGLEGEAIPARCGRALSSMVTTPSASEKNAPLCAEPPGLEQLPPREMGLAQLPPPSRPPFLRAGLIGFGAKKSERPP